MLSFPWPYISRRSPALALRPRRFGGAQIGGAQRRLELGGVAELRLHARIHFFANPMRLGIDAVLVDSDKLAVLQHPSAVDHYVGQRDTVLAMDDLFDHIVERHEGIRVHIQEGEISGLASSNGAELAGQPQRAGTLRRRRMQDLLWRRPGFVVTVVPVMQNSGDPHSLKHILSVVAAVAVSAKPDADVPAQHVIEAHAPGAELAVAHRIVDDDGALVGDAVDVLGSEPDAMRHRQPLIERADAIEMGDWRAAKELVALQELALGLAHMHMHHDIEISSQLGTAL